MPDNDTSDLVIIGGGPGGYVAAIHAAQLGLRVTVVEKDPFLGGTCLHRGCIPTKALLHTAELVEDARRAADFGVSLGEPGVDLAQAHAYKDRVVAKNAKGIELLLRKHGIETVHGTGRLGSPHTVDVATDEGETRSLAAKHVIIATGSAPLDLPFARCDGERILNSDQILDIDEIPSSLAILGAGAVGVEFASMFAAFGAGVMLIELLPRILPLEDEEISRGLQRSLGKRGIEILTGARATGVSVSDSAPQLELEVGDELRTVECERLLLAVGRAPVTAGLGLAEAGIELEDGFIKVNELMQTSLPHVYAIGDVVGTAQLAHLASAEGIVAVEHAAGRGPRPIDYDRVPSCTYCDPEVASVGLSEERARERGHEVATGKFPFTASGKAAILGKTEGFVKIVRETTHDQVLGVHILGPKATDLIAEACLALGLESTNEELWRTIHPHPTLSEAMMEAAHVAAGHGVHV